MLNFNGIYQCALHRSEDERHDEHIDVEKVAALHAELGPVQWPDSCPWVGTDAWLQRFIQRAEDAMKEPIEKDAQGIDKPRYSAADRVRNCLKWRQENGVNELLVEPISPLLLHLHAEWPLHSHGVDRFGIPVFYERVALVYPRPFMERYTLEQAFQFALFSREQVARAVYQHSDGGKRSRYIHVCSAANLGLRHGHQPLFTLLDKVFMNDEANYPLSVRHYFVVNTPWLFSLFKSILSPFVNSEPLQKIKTYGHDVLRELEPFVDVAHVPREMGGKCEAHADSPHCLAEFCEARLLAGGDTPAGPHNHHHHHRGHHHHHQDKEEKRLSK